LLIQATKAGQIFVLNRATGVPFHTVAERPVPQGGAPGERLARTQPFSVGIPQIGAERLREADMWGITPFDQLACRIGFRRLRYEGLFTPPGTDATLVYPSPLGGMNWGNSAIDPANHRLIVNDSRVAYWVRLVPRKLADAPDAASRPWFGPMKGTPFGFEGDRLLSPLSLPCRKPPFGTMSAIDLRTGRLVWQVPMGTVEDSRLAGLRMGVPIPLGLPTRAGPLVTQSGLVFYAGAQDHYMRALDVATGRLLWKARLPVDSQSTPMSFRSPRSGRQYVVVDTGDARDHPESGGYLVAYALPDRPSPR
jgi:quinate dehydrogenase (quinone)